MTLWIQPLFGEVFSIPFSPSDKSFTIHNLYRYLHLHYYNDFLMHQIQLYNMKKEEEKEEEKEYYNYNILYENNFLELKEGDILHIFISEPFVEKWVSEYENLSDQNYIYQNSCITWYDGLWGNPYENPSITIRPANMIYIQAKKCKDKPTFIQFIITNFSESNPLWYSTLEEACHAFREKWNKISAANSFTENTMIHIISLWKLYQGTNYHLIEKSRYYDY